LGNGDKDAWTASQFAAELKVTVSQTWVATQPLASSMAEVVVGGIVFWRVADELQVLNLVVHTGCRRRGLGRHLLAAALSAGRDAGCATAWLEVRADNAAAIGLYEQAGFAASGRRRGYYSGSGADALLMAMCL
jgi:ribosomal-protein-alanine N-acetyltransferase